MKRRIIFGWALSSLLVFSYPGRLSAGLIDSFDSSGFAGVLFTSPSSDSLDEAVAGVAGGQRFLEATATAATSLVNSIGFEIAGGSANYSSGPSADGTLEFLYDGPSLPSAFPEPMSSISLDFALFDAAFDAAMDVTITVSDGVNSADLTQSLITASMTPFSFAFDLSMFNNVGAVDLGNLGSIDIFFDPAAGQDFEINGVSFTMMPEPSTLVLLALGVVAWLGVAFRR